MVPSNDIRRERSSNSMRILGSAVAFALVTGIAALDPTPAKAELIIDFYDNFGGSTPSGTSNPLLTAIIKNVAGGAEITVESFLEPPNNSEYVEQISFNLSSIDPPSDTSYASNGCNVLSGQFSCALTTFDVEPPPINQPDLSAVVNAALNFATAFRSDAERFDANDKGTFFVAGLSEGMLLTFTAIDNNGINQTLYAGAKINGIANGGSTSIGGIRRRVPVPLPIIGATVAFGISRNLRTRMSQREQAL